MNSQMNTAWERLHSDPELGAGNFLFKAHEVYPDKEKDFLFLEEPFTVPGGNVHTSFSLDTLRDAVFDLSRWYTNNGIRSGTYVCLYLEEGISSFLHFLALNSIGCVPVLINGNLLSEIAVAYAQINHFDVFVYDATTESRWGIAAQLKHVRSLEATFPENGVNKDNRNDDVTWPVPRKGNDVIMICHSSGTTGIPKAVIFTHNQFFEGKRDRLRSFVESDTEKMVAAMPTTHAAGISYLMTAVLLQIPTLSVKNQCGRQVAELIAEYGPTVVTAFPRTYSSFSGLNLPDQYLKSVRRFYNTADSAHEAHIREVLRLAPDARFIDMFGASELGMSQFYKVSQSGSIAACRSVGKPAPYADCAILSPRGDVLPDGEAGYIGVRSPTITPGYYGQPHLTALSRLNSYWLTGDIGIKLSNGEFIHLDRTVDVVDTFLGKKAYTLLIEEHLLKIKEIKDVTVVGIRRGPANEQVVVALVSEIDESIKLSALKVLRHALITQPFLGAELPAHSICVAILAHGYDLPVGSTGKVLKRNLREKFWDLQREYDSGVRSKLKELLWNHQLVTTGANSVAAM